MERGVMSWFKSLFHGINTHNLAGALGAAKTSIDQLAIVEKWDWISQFDQAAGSAITSLNTWQKGDSTVEITQSLNTAVGVVNSAQGVSPKDKMVITVFVTTAETALAFLG
jgi:hypothetical protein